MAAVVDVFVVIFGSSLLLFFEKPKMRLLGNAVNAKMNKTWTQRSARGRRLRESTISSSFFLSRSMENGNK